MTDDGGGGASSKSSYSSIYDVFLSFKGEIRHSFTDHLYHALTKNGINTFRDTEKLRVGEEIRPSLLDAIQRSRMSIPVLSQNYAFSSWCLDELVKIMECSENGRNRPVLPVFYHVVPSDLRHQKNQFGRAMAKHEDRYGKDSKRVQAWRSALFAVCELSGVDCNGRSENDIIKKIVGEVLKKLPREPLHIKHQVELDSRFEDLKSLLDIESRDTLCMLCIYGDGETNKTMFVGALYNKISDGFDAACFLDKVSEKSKESINGLEGLQKTLLCEMGHHVPNAALGSTFRGCSEIKRMLGHKRVLLILDDVDSVEQLESLAGGADWFGPGSRIIVTTRDEYLLDKHVLDGVDIKRYCIDECDLEAMKATESNKKRKRGVEEEGDVVGFDDSLRIVINQLKEEDPFHNVVSITGMGGLGKTTLARKIYENNEVKNLFPCRAMCSISKDFNERKVFLDLLNCLKSSTSRFEDLREEKLKEEVRKCLIRNKYLVVLDDIWEPEVWDKVKYVFPNNHKGSMILITSRNDQVANYSGSRSPHHKLLPLNAEKSWELFCMKVFGGEECPSNLEPIGKSIVEKCGGLPLAIITIAGLIARKERSCIEWSRIEGYVHWHLAEDSTKVMDVLKVSYNSLPQVLKPCFLYFGIYPEDYEICARELIQLWMAEGLIQPKRTRTSKVPRPEDVGEDYLNQLVDRNLVQVVKRRTIDGGVKKCRFHDLLRELCILESGINNLLEICTESSSDSLSNYSRLSFLCDAKYSASLIKGNMSSTRSLFFFARKSYSAEDIMKNFPMLYVLHVEPYVGFKEIPYDLKMIHLKYLRVKAYNSTRDNIPDWIWSLDNLETLDLRGWIPSKRSISIWKLERLRHFYTSYSVMLEMDEEGANSKPIMWNLQTLTNVVVEPKTMLLINTDRFPNLVKLSLIFNYIRIRPQPQHKPKLLELHNLSNLRTLKIDLCRLSVSFDKIEFPPNVSKITLERIDKVDDSGYMSVLGQIPRLRVLKLKGEWTNGDTLNCGVAGDFPQLEVFHMTNFHFLRRITIEDGAMPLLQHMLISRCFKLKDIPERLLHLCEIK